MAGIPAGPRILTATTDKVEPVTQFVEANSLPMQHYVVYSMDAAPEPVSKLPGVIWENQASARPIGAKPDPLYVPPRKAGRNWYK